VAVERRESGSRIDLGFFIRLRRYGMFLVHLLLGYGVVMLLVYLFQYRLLYFPDAISVEEVTRHARGLGLQPWPGEAENYRGLVTVNAARAAAGTVLVFHGNAGSALDRKYYPDALERLGYRVILVEYPGYGGRRGKLGEASFAADARDLVKLAWTEFGAPIYVWGESLGCGVATAAAADPALEVAGVILLTPWDTLGNTAQAHYWWLPARWLTRDRYDNIRNLEAYAGPVVVIMADQDEVIPNRLTKKLFEALRTSKRLWAFPGAGHNSWPTAPERAWWAEVMGFVAGRGDGR
jgi:pimeloyl-ACP methyl ester carboxylesterase